MKQIYLVVCDVTAYGENGRELFSTRTNWSGHTTYDGALNAIGKYLKMTKKREGETRQWKVETIFIDD